MEFLGIGYQEVLLVLVLMLIVVGPERMPQVAYQIGRAVREMQKYARAVRDEFREEFDYFEEQAREVRGEMESARGDMEQIRRSLREESRAIDRDLKDATAEVNKAIEPEKNGAGGTNGTKALPAAGRAAVGGSLSQPRSSKPAATTPADGEPEAGATSEGKEPEPDKPPLVF